MRTTAKRRHPWLDGVRELPILAGCSDEELEAFASTMTPVTIPAGRRVVAEGSLGREALVIEEGRASVSIGDAEVAVLGPGDVVGEMAVLSRGRRCASVTAMTSLKVHDASAADFRSLLERAPRFRERVLAAASGRGLVAPIPPVAGPAAEGRWHHRAGRA